MLREREKNLLQIGIFNETTFFFFQRKKKCLVSTIDEGGKGWCNYFEKYELQIEDKFN